MAVTKTYSLRLADDVGAFLKARAASEQRSVAFVVMALVRETMAREAKKSAKPDKPVKKG